MEKSSFFAERQCLGTQGRSQEEQLLAKVKGSRETVPCYSPPQRSSVYRGVTRNESQNKKVRQVYLEATVKRQRQHAYDLAALIYWGPETILNFPVSQHELLFSRKWKANPKKSASEL